MPSSADAYLAAAAIYDRHRTAGDEQLWRLANPADPETPTDLAAVVDYVARWYRQVGPKDRTADAFDVMLIVRWQARRLDLVTRNMITIARDGIDPDTGLRPLWSRLAGPLGVNSRQAAFQLYQRLRNWSKPLDEGLHTPGRRSVVADRQRRAELGPDARVANPSPRDVAQTTVPAVVELLRQLQEERRDLPAELLDDLDAAISSPNPANTLGLVRTVVADLLAVVEELPAPLAGLAREADQLLHR